MHSKWKVWDFFKSGVQSTKSHKGPIFFYGYDPLVFYMFKNYLKQENVLSTDISVKISSEINVEWIEDQFKSLSFFSESQDFIIHDCESLTKNVQEQLLNIDELNFEQNVFFNFNKKNSFYNEIAKLQNNNVQVIEIVEPFFWEEMMVIDFLQEYLKVYLSYPAKNYIKESVPFDLKEYYDSLNILKINYPEKKELSFDEVSALISEQKVDPFELADFFGGKKLHAFYQKLLQYQSAGVDLIGVISFVQSHMLKIYDPSYAQKKKKLSKYDKLIIAQEKIWDKDQIFRSLTYLGELLIDLKTKENFLIDKVRLDDLSLNS